MAIQTVNNLLITSAENYGAAAPSATVNAAGESAGIVGRVRLQGNATSKVISAAGSGKFLWSAGAVTFATAGTTLRVGIQDVDTTTGLEDGTFDAFKEYVQGTDTITASAYNLATMSSGTKTLSDGDLVALVVEMPVRNGADSVVVNRTAGGPMEALVSLGLPYGTVDSGALAKTSTGFLLAMLSFDDGTVGWIEGAYVSGQVTSSLAVNSGSSPDEYIGTFVPTWTMNVCGIGSVLSSIASADPFELILYSDPYGTPVAVQTVTPDPDVVGGAGSASLHIGQIPVTTLSAGTTYGVSFRPTSTNPITYFYADYTTTAIAALVKAASPLPQLKVAARTNQTGAFVEVSAAQLPFIALDVCGLDDGVGTSVPMMEMSMPMVVLPRGAAGY